MSFLEQQEFEFVEDLQGMCVSAFGDSLRSAHSLILSVREIAALESLATAKRTCQVEHKVVKKARVESAGSRYRMATGTAERVAVMIHTGTQNVQYVSNQVPLQALNQLERDVVTEEQRLQWLEQARLRAIAGFCPKLVGCGVGLPLPSAF